MTRPCALARGRIGAVCTCAHSLMLLALVGCSGNRSARLIVGLSDTVVVNTTRPVAIPVNVVDSAGRVLTSKRPRFQWLAGDNVRVTDAGEVTCPHTGDATMRASLGRLSTTFVLYCRPMRGFEFGMNNYALFVGGPSKALDVVGRGVDGHPVTLIAARLRLHDSLVASLDHGRVSPRKPGETMIEVEAGDSRTSLHIEVIQLVGTPDELRPYHAFITHVRLAGGETQSWRVPPGRYEFRFVADAAGRDRVLLATTGANCARYSDGGPHLSCVASADATVIVGNPGRAGRDGLLTGELAVRRMGDSPSSFDYRLDMNR